jgi:hypothetical protein
MDPALEPTECNVAKHCMAANATQRHKVLTQHTMQHVRGLGYAPGLLQCENHTAVASASTCMRGPACICSLALEGVVSLHAFLLDRCCFPHATNPTQSDCCDVGCRQRFQRQHNVAAAQRQYCTSLYTAMAVQRPTAWPHCCCCCCCCCASAASLASGAPPLLLPAAAAAAATGRCTSAALPISPQTSAAACCCCCC